jgi:hypothetical protein
MDSNICPKCGGKGVVYSKMKSEKLGIEFSGVVDCECRLQILFNRNLERAWRGLSKVSNLDKVSPLVKYLDSDLWLTLNSHSLRVHLKNSAETQSINWYFKVVSDADLMSSWLHNIEAKEIYDPDMVEGEILSETKQTDLASFSLPPKLLIIVLGVKVARNVAMPEVLLEVLTQRGHLMKPTWIVDQPSHLLDSNHRCYSEQLIEYLKEFKRMSGSEPKVAATTNTRPTLSRR